jgi:hypothetical protein
MPRGVAITRDVHGSVDAVQRAFAGIRELDMAAMRADVAAQPDQPSVIELAKRRIEHPAVDADRVGELADGQGPMRLVKDRVPHGTQRGGRDGAELEHDSDLPDSSGAQSLVSGDRTRVEKPGRRERASSRGLSPNAR